MPETISGSSGSVKPLTCDNPGASRSLLNRNEQDPSEPANSFLTGTCIRLGAKVEQTLDQRENASIGPTSSLLSDEVDLGDTQR